MKRRFLNQHRPVITSLFSGETPVELTAKTAESSSLRADGIAIELHALKPEYRNRDSLKGVIEAADLPFMFCFYRKDAWEDRDDDARQELLLAAADAGASMIDVMGDLYDPSPFELTRTPAAVEKQMRLIDTLHTKGAHVVISSHMACFRSTDEVVEHLKTVEARGADVVKLVQTTDTELELEQALRTTLALRRELKVPFIHLCTGKFSRPHRFFGPALGVSICFAVRGHENGDTPQPTITELKAVLDNLRWNIDRPA